MDFKWNQSYLKIMRWRGIRCSMIAARKKAPISQMQPNVAKIVEAILFIIEEAGRREQSVTRYDIVKTIFLADRAHLNKYGRPITFDNYFAMVHGPVPSTAYDVLKNDTSVGRLLSEPVPWKSKAAPELGRNATAYFEPGRAPDSSVLSPSDFEEIEAALTIVKSLGFAQIRRLTHEDQAYLDAWEDDDNTARYPMSYSLLFDNPNEEGANQLSFMSKHV